MNEIALPTYRELKLALAKTSLMLNPSQAHGVLCGVLCADRERSMSLATLLPLFSGDKPPRKASTLLNQLHTASLQQLEAFLFEFQLLLPKDKEKLTIRAEALTLWAQGFLTGLKMMNIPLQPPNPSELTEAIEDIMEIAQMNYEEVVESEEDEQAYMELVEYIRMAVIFIYQALQEGKVVNRAEPTLKQLH